MHRTIVEAINVLGDQGLVFGSEDRQKGEADFQLALGEKLEELTEKDGWKWRYGGRNEEAFETSALGNKDTIKIDIVGRHAERGMVAIELKYVPASPSRGGVPSNPPAFGYDIAKDCLRMDLLCARECAPLGEPIPYNVQTYVIGLTNWSDYWQDSKQKRGWAANFYAAMRSKPLPRFEGLIRTLGRNSENTIALGRCHIAFGRSWTGEWLPYGSSNQTEKFRYLFLTPDIGANPRWTHGGHADADTIFPFLNAHSREGWFRRKKTIKRGARDQQTGPTSTGSP